MAEILKTVALCKTYGDGSAAVHALRSVELSIQAHTLTAITGPSGSGKSTLLHLLGGLVRPTSGQVLLNGRDLARLTPEELAAVRRREIGFVFQQFRLLPEYTVRDNILMPLYLDKRDPDEAYLARLAEELGLADKLTARPHQLSGGQQQRTALARALIAHPQILLADEPTGNLDQANGEQVFRLLQAACRKHGQTVVFVTHAEPLAQQADRVVRICDGRLV